MHGNIDTRTRYAPCTNCGHPLGLDNVTGKCCITSCRNYFGTPTTPTPEPLPPRTRNLIAAEQAVIEAARQYVLTPTLHFKHELRYAIERLDIIEDHQRKVIPFVKEPQ